jgi:hypothetical protein
MTVARPIPNFAITARSRFAVGGFAPYHSSG